MACYNVKFAVTQTNYCGITYGVSLVFYGSPVINVVPYKRQPKDQICKLIETRVQDAVFSLKMDTSNIS
jgi:hypothetical protein